VHEGVLRAPSPIPTGEIAIFEPSEEPIDFVAQETPGSSSVRRRSIRTSSSSANYSVHTSAAALRQGEAEIRRVGQELRAKGTLRR